MLQRFPHKGPDSIVSNALFFEIDKKETSRNIFQVGIGNNIIDQATIFCNRMAFQKTGLIVIF